MKVNKLSIIIPVYNEEKTILAVLEIISGLQLIEGIEKEVLLINDCSSDSSKEIIEEYIAKNQLSSSFSLLNRTENKGKGAALHYGIKSATGDFLIPQDADLELDPNDINHLLRKLIDDELDVVYGSRFLQNENPSKNASYYANQFLTAFSNLLSGWKISDMETCYKLIRTSIAKGLILKEERFGFEPEITARLAQVKGIKVGEIPVKYTFRNYEEGKKIGWQDGVKAMWCIVKYNLSP